MTYETDNLTLLQNKFPRTFSRLPTEVENVPHFYLIRDGQGQLTGMVAAEGKERQFISKYDPEKQARLFAEKHFSDTIDAIIVVGLQLGYIPRSLLQKMTSRQTLIIIEPDHHLFHEQIKVCDSKDVFNDPRLEIIIDNNVARCMDTIKIDLWNRKAENVAFVITPVYEEIFAEYAFELKKSFLREQELRAQRKADFSKGCEEIRAHYFNEQGQMGDVKTFLQKINEYAVKEQSSLVERSYLLTGMFLTYKAYTEMSGT